MGIKSAFRTIVRHARGTRPSEFECVVDHGRPEGLAAATTAAATVGFDRSEADEKFILSGLVVDDWDGAVALLSRRR